MSHERDDFSVHKEIEISDIAGERFIVGHTHGEDGMSGDEIRHRTAEAWDVDPAQIIVRHPGTGEISSAPQSERRSRTYGFSKWSAKWEPTGPKGNPSLN